MIRAAICGVVGVQSQPAVRLNAFGGLWTITATASRCNGKVSQEVRVRRSASPRLGGPSSRPFRQSLIKGRDPGGRSRGAPPEFTDPPTARRGGRGPPPTARRDVAGASALPSAHGHALGRPAACCDATSTPNSWTPAAAGHELGSGDHEAVHLAELVTAARAERRNSRPRSSATTLSQRVSPIRVTASNESLPPSGAKKLSRGDASW